ncbi:MAG: thioredoxin-like domain-containing protein [Thermomicrobiales bacterium]
MDRDPASYAGAVRAPDFPGDAVWIGSAPIQLSELRGRVVLLDFWTSGCINCMHILPNLHRLHLAFPDQLQIIGVHTPKFSAEKDPDRLALAIDRLGIHHPVVSDPDYAIWQSYAVDAWPTLIFIDQRGRVVARHAGEFDYDRVHAFIEALVTSAEAVDPASEHPRSRPGSQQQDPVEDSERIRSGHTTLRFPAKVVVDPIQHRLVIADSGNHRILIATLDGIVLTTIGTGLPGADDGDFSVATFTHPQGIAFSPDGQSIVVADAGNHLLRRIDLAAGTVSTVAGTGQRGLPAVGGPARETALASPWDVIWFEERYLIAMAGLHQVWSYDPATGRFCTMAGTGSNRFTMIVSPMPRSPSRWARCPRESRFMRAVDAESSAVRALDCDSGRVRRLDEDFISAILTRSATVSDCNIRKRNCRDRRGRPTSALSG